MSGGFDGRLNVCDVRAPKGSLSYQLDSKKCKDIEAMQWHPKSEHNFVTTTESGMVYGFDTRNFAKPLFEMQAHKKACSNVSFSPHIANMMATVGVDHTCKVWDIHASGGPQVIGERDLKQGELFSVQFYEDIPWVLAAGGSKGEVAIWDTEETAAVASHFAATLDPNAPKQPEPMEDDGDADFEDVSDEGVVKASSRDKKQKKKAKK